MSQCKICGELHLNPPSPLSFAAPICKTVLVSPTPQLVARWEEFREWFKRVTRGNLNAASGIYDWNGLEDDFWEKLAQVAAEAREAALEEAAVIAETLSDCDLRCMNDCKLHCGDAIRALKALVEPEWSQCTHCGGPADFGCTMCEECFESSKSGAV